MPQHNSDPAVGIPAGPDLEQALSAIRRVEPGRHASGDDFQGLVLREGRLLRYGEAMVAVRHLRSSYAPPGYSAGLARTGRSRPGRPGSAAPDSSSSAARDFSGLPGGCSGKLEASTACAPSSRAVRQATRAPALRPPATTGGPGRSSSGHSARQPVSSALGAGATFLPATRQGCSTRATVTPSGGSAAASAWQVARLDRRRRRRDRERGRAAGRRAECQVIRASPTGVSTICSLGLPAALPAPFLSAPLLAPLAWPVLRVLFVSLVLPVARPSCRATGGPSPRTAVGGAPLHPFRRACSPPAPPAPPPARARCYGHC